MLFLRTFSCRDWGSMEKKDGAAFRISLLSSSGLKNSWKSEKKIWVFSTMDNSNQIFFLFCFLMTLLQTDIKNDFGFEWRNNFIFTCIIFIFLVRWSHQHIDEFWKSKFRGNLAILNLKFESFLVQKKLFYLNFVRKECI